MLKPTMKSILAIGTKGAVFSLTFMHVDSH